MGFLGLMPVPVPVPMLVQLLCRLQRHPLMHLLGHAGSPYPRKLRGFMDPNLGYPSSWVAHKPISLRALPAQQGGYIHHLHPTSYLSLFSQQSHPCFSQLIVARTGVTLVYT